MLPAWTSAVLGLVSPSQARSEDIRAEQREWPGQRLHSGAMLPSYTSTLTALLAWQ